MIGNEVKRQCKMAKETWYNRKCEEIERDPRDIYKKIDGVRGKRKYCSASGCIKGKDNSIIMDKDKILERWSEYIEELFDDTRGGVPEIYKNIEGPSILPFEVRAASEKMKNNKAPGPDGITTEMIKALDDFGIEKITILANEVYDNGKIPEDLSRSIFIMIPKKPDAIECELHMTISLMSHILKLILRIIMPRIRRVIRPEISQTQCGFVADAGTRNAIFMIRLQSEKAMEKQKDLHICFLDYTKAFDRVKHEKILELLQRLDTNGKDIQLIRNLYWEQQACIRTGNLMSGYTSIKRGVRQGCVLSPDLFNLYSETILREIEDLNGFIISGHNVTNLRYADDTMLIADSEEKIQALPDRVTVESEKMGLTLNQKKTEYMIISKRECNKSNLRIGNTALKQAQKYIYLGSLITQNGKCDEEIKRRIAMAKSNFVKLEHVLKNRKIGLELRKLILYCYVIPVLTYGCEAWTLTSEMTRRLEASEMWMYRRMMRISFSQHMSNEEVLRKVEADRNLIKNIRKRQLEFLGHTLRKDGMENLCITGFVEGKRGRGRQSITSLDSLTKWMNGKFPEQNLTSAKLLKIARDRSVEDHDHLRPQWAWYLKKERKNSHVKVHSAYVLANAKEQYVLNNRLVIYCVYLPKTTVKLNFFKSNCICQYRYFHH